MQWSKLQAAQSRQHAVVAKSPNLRGKGSVTGKHGIWERISGGTARKKTHGSVCNLDISHNNSNPRHRA